jgi:hypothetical protein
MRLEIPQRPFNPRNFRLPLDPGLIGEMYAVLMVVLWAAFTWLVPHPTPFQVAGFRILLALSAFSSAVALPGVAGSISGGGAALRTLGAIVVSAVVFALSYLIF